MSFARKLAAFGSRVTRKAALRQAIVDHNAKFDEVKARRMPLVVPQPQPEEKKPEPVVAKEKRAPLPSVVQLSLALMARHLSLPNRFRGYVPKRISPRAAARAEGYANVREKTALENAERLRKEFVAQEKAEAEALKKLAETQPQPEGAPA